MNSKPKYIDEVTKTDSSHDLYSIQSHVNPEKVAAILDGLAKKYHYPYAAVVREYVSNGIDSHIRANQNKAVEVTLPTDIFPNLIIQDFGLGMSFEEISENFAHYMMGSKESDTTQIGFFGIGSKSAFAIADQFILNSVQNGLKNVVFASKNEHGTKYDFGIQNQKTDEDNGVTITIPIREDRISEFTSGHNQTHLSVIGWSKDQVKVINDTEDGFWNYRIPGSEDFLEYDNFFLRKDSSNTDYRKDYRGFILGGVFYNSPRRSSNHNLPNSVIPKFEAHELYPEESRERIRDTKSNEAMYDKRVEEIMNLLKSKIIEEMEKLETREEKLILLDSSNVLRGETIEIDGEKFSSQLMIHSNKTWNVRCAEPFSFSGHYEKNTYIRSRVNNVFVGRDGNSESLSPTVMSNFCDDFTFEEIPKDFVELKNIHKLYVGKGHVNFTDASMEELEAVSVGEIHNGTRIRLQIASMRKERNQSMKSKKGTTLNAEKVKGNLYISEDKRDENIHRGTMKEIIEAIKTNTSGKKVVLMNEKNTSWDYVKNFILVFPIDNKVTSTKAVQKVLEENDIQIDFIYPSTDEMRQEMKKIAYAELDEDAKIFGKFFELAANRFEIKKRKSLSRSTLETIFAPEKEKENTRNHYYYRNDDLDSEFFTQDETVKIDEKAFEKIMEKDSTYMFTIIFSHANYGHNIFTDKKLFKIAKKIVQKLSVKND